MIYCESCGKQLTENAKFCPECGARVTPQSAPEPIELPSQRPPEPSDLPRRTLGPTDLPRRTLEPQDLPSHRAPGPADLPSRGAPEPTELPQRGLGPDDLASRRAPEATDLPPRGVMEPDDLASRRAPEPVELPPRSPAAAQRGIYELADLRPEQPPPTIREAHEPEAPKHVVPQYQKAVQPGAAKILTGDPIYMSQQAFHLYLRELCLALGYTQKPSAAAEDGADFVLERDGQTTVLRMELSTGSVGPGEEAIAKAYEARTQHNANEAVVATNRFFEDDAREAAGQLGVELWDILSLRRMRNEVLAHAL